MLFEVILYIITSTSQHLEPNRCFTLKINFTVLDRLNSSN